MGDQEKFAIMEYRGNLTNNMIVPQPKFIQYDNNILYLSEEIVSLEEALALKTYL